MNITLDTVADGFAFTEGPRWHEDQLWFSDFYQHLVFTVLPDGECRPVAEVPMQPSGLGWLPDGRLLVVSMLDRRVLSFDGVTTEVHADLSALAGGPCNDMIVDDSGYAYVGNFGFDRGRGDEPRPATLIGVAPDGKASVVAEDLAFPNGMAITPDSATLLVAESRALRITAFDRAPDGSLSNRRLWSDVAPAHPDGICLDEQGALWFADSSSGDVIRVREGGEELDRLEFDGRHALALVLGGPERTTLFLCTNVAPQPHFTETRRGKIESCVVPIPGAGIP